MVGYGLYMSIVELDKRNIMSAVGSKVTCVKEHFFLLLLILSPTHCPQQTKLEISSMFTCIFSAVCGYLYRISL